MTVFTVLEVSSSEDSEIVTFSGEVSVDSVTVTVLTESEDSVLKWGIIIKK